VDETERQMLRARNGEKRFVTSIKAYGKGTDFSAFS
jgi:hypothetical protein